MTGLAARTSDSPRLEPILWTGFSIENDCLTPTFKLKRPQLLKKYQEQVRLAASTAASRLP